MSSWERHVPPADSIVAAVEAVVERGVRRPAYDADRWTERYVVERFEALGLHDVRAEPVEVVRWEDGPARLEVSGPTGRAELEGFPLPHTAVAGDVSGRIVSVQDVEGDGTGGSGAIVVQRHNLPKVPNTALLKRAMDHHDPEGHFERSMHVMPFGAEVHDVTAKAERAGAAGFVGLLGENLNESDGYYLPYDGLHRQIPAAWLRPSYSNRLEELMAAGGLTGHLRVSSSREVDVTANIVGTLRGSSDHWVIVGTHHDAPWASAVEDGSGVALVLAQAEMWAGVPASERPHNMLFLVNGAHMMGGRGVHTFIAEHRAFLDDVVLEVHLEHAARAAAVAADGSVVRSTDPEDRWWFATEHPDLVGALMQAIRSEDLGRSIVFPPEAFMPHPPTDGGPFHLEGVPLVNFLPAPWYLFSDCDTMQMLHNESLVPVTRAVAQVIASTAGMVPSSLRAN